MSMNAEKTYEVSYAESMPPSGGGGIAMSSSSTGDANMDGGGDRVQRVDWGVRSREIAPKLHRFETALIDMLSRKIGACSNIRERWNFSKEMETARVMAAAKSRIWVNANGEVVVQSGESNAIAGMQLGYSAQAIDYAAARIFRDNYEAAERPFVVSARADKQENVPVVETLTAMIDHLLRQGEFLKIANLVCGECPTTGTGVLRVEAISPVVMVRDSKTGAWSKRLLDPEFSFSSWKIEDVLVTNLECPRPEEQEGVFWVTRNTTASALMSDVAIYENVPMDDSGAMFFQRVGGKYFNLRYLWETQPVATYGVYDQSWGQSQMVSDDEPLVKVEYEGRINFRDMVRKGVLDAEILSFFGIDLGIPMMAPEDPQELSAYQDELAFRASEINYTVAWVVKQSQVIAQNVGAGYMTWSWLQGATGGDLVAFDDGRQRKGPNTLYRYPWLNQAGLFMGQGIPSRGSSIEYQANGIANSLVAGSQMASNPAVFFDGTKIPQALRDDIAKEGLVPGKAYDTKVKPEEVFAPYAIAFDAKGFETLDRMFQWFTNVTAIGPELKGQDKPTTGTLGELQIDVAAAGVFMARIVLDHARENFRMIRDMLETYEMIVGREGVLKLADIVAPYYTEDFDINYTDMESLMDEYAFVHPSILGSNRTMLFEQMLKLFTSAGMLPDPENPMKTIMDPWKFVEKMMGVLGLQEVSSWMSERSKIVPIHVQHRMMEAGNYISPGLMDLHEAEIPEHEMKRDAIIMGMESTGSPERDEMVVRMLNHHIAEHEQKALEKNALLMAQQAQQMQMGGMGGEEMGAGEPATPPPDETQGQVNLMRSATSGIPGGGSAIPA